MHKTGRLCICQCQNHLLCRDQLFIVRYVWIWVGMLLLLLCVWRLVSVCAPGLCAMFAYSWYGNKVISEFMDPNYKAKKWIFHSFNTWYKCYRFHLIPNLKPDVFDGVTGLNWEQLCLWVGVVRLFSSLEDLFTASLQGKKSANLGINLLILRVSFLTDAYIQYASVMTAYFSTLLVMTCFWQN